MRGTSAQIFLWGELTMTAKFNLAAGAVLIIPAGRVLLFITSSDADITDLILQMDYDTVKVNVVNYDGGQWACLGANAWEPVPNPVKSDGANIQIKNNGAGSIDNIQYAYMEAS